MRGSFVLTTPRLSRKLRAWVTTVVGTSIAALTLLTPSLTETAVANGDTRTIYLHHAHTNESIAATYLVGGQYDSNVLRQLNWFLRDWRRDEPTNMDPRLFDVVWEAYRSAGAGNEVINVVSAYRSPETNAMLRSRSRAVAKYSQHMLGKAMDTTMPGMPMSRIREVGMRMQRGGVGYYPTAGTPFVHLDVGNVRSWPRMSYDQLVRLFPDGKTVHLPTNGQPLARYEEARAEIEARGDGAYVTAPRRTIGGFFAMLFGGGGGGEEDDAEITAPAPSTRKQWSALAPRGGRGAKADPESGEEGGAESAGKAERTQIARAETNLPRGETTMSPGAGESTQEALKETPDKEPSTERVPLPPPGRPATLAALSEKTANVAETDASANETRGAADPQQSIGNADSEKPLHKYVNAPLPPHRPVLTYATLSGAPTSSARPQTNAARALATLVDSKNPASAKAKQGDDAPLAYAEPATAKTATSAKSDQRKSGQKAELVPARLDRSNFKALTGAAPASQSATRSVMGTPIGAVRSAARAASSSVLTPPRAAKASGFSNAAPPSDKFAPSAQNTR